MKEEIQAKYDVVRSDLQKAQECLDTAMSELSAGFLIDNSTYKKEDIIEKYNEISDIEDDVYGKIFPAISNM